MARRRKKKERIPDLGLGGKSRQQYHVATIFAKRDSKDNFFTPGGRIKRILGIRKRRGTTATINISGAGRPDKERDVPQIAGGGRKARATMDISGARPARGGGPVPAVSAAGKPSDKVPSIGGGGARSPGVPDISGRDRARGKSTVPEIGAAGRKADDRVPDIGGDGVKAAGVPDIGGTEDMQGDALDISGAMSGRKRKRSGNERYVSGIRRSVGAYIGFRELTPAEEAEFELFVRRAHQAGHEVPYRQLLSWRAEIMLNQIKPGDLWGTDVGADIERKYGSKGQDLDLPETDRPRRTFTERQEERKEGGVIVRLKSWLSRFKR